MPSLSDMNEVTGLNPAPECTPPCTPKAPARPGQAGVDFMAGTEPAAGRGTLLGRDQPAHASGGTLAGTHWQAFRESHASDGDDDETTDYRGGCYASMPRPYLAKEKRSRLDTGPSSPDTSACATA
jgi:hypothetical protein